MVVNLEDFELVGQAEFRKLNYMYTWDGNELAVIRK